MNFVFILLDLDADGLLGGPDLLNCQDNIECSSDFGLELKRLTFHYVRTHLVPKEPVLSHNLLSLDRYMTLIPKSCLIDEFRRKILSKPGKHST